MPWLALLFFLTAILYASVGFGGGSTYIALLALADIDYRIIPIVALLCNIIVVTGASLRFQVSGLIPWRRAWPILLLSIPAAWLGGRIPIEREAFLLLLGSSLAIAAFLLLSNSKPKSNPAKDTGAKKQSLLIAPAIGTAIGFLSGMVGIGGGIFLAPILLLINWSDTRRIAATASIFILVNSLAGLAGQFSKTGWEEATVTIAEYWPLFVAVFLGGQIGSHLASKALTEMWIRRLTALLILYVASRIWWQQIA
ncbi:Possible sulfoacetate exporter [hydrothermal vent metagenome]|uniref:Possible sulfoacetate exporter n=1 Tax=hydrothermal vent metagenome TaxID=652676 RepID=A0A3B0S220_9ZZZZ